MTTVLGNISFDFTFKSYYLFYEIACVGLLVMYYIFWKFQIEIKGKTSGCCCVILFRYFHRTIYLFLLFFLSFFRWLRTTAELEFRNLCAQETFRTLIVLRVVLHRRITVSLFCTIFHRLPAHRRANIEPRTAQCLLPEKVKWHQLFSVLNRNDSRRLLFGNVYILECKFAQFRIILVRSKFTKSKLIIIYQFLSRSIKPSGQWLLRTSSSSISGHWCLIWKFPSKCPRILNNILKSKTNFCLSYFSGLLHGLFFFAISINLLIQSTIVIEDLRMKTDEESETISLFTVGILSFGLALR